MFNKFSELGIEVICVGPPSNVGKKQVSINRVLALANLARKHKSRLID